MKEAWSTNGNNQRLGNNHDPRHLLNTTNAHAPVGCELGSLRFWRFTSSVKCGCFETFPKTLRLSCLLSIYSFSLLFVAQWQRGTDNGGKIMFTVSYTISSKPFGKHRFEFCNWYRFAELHLGYLLLDVRSHLEHAVHDVGIVHFVEYGIWFTFFHSRFPIFLQSYVKRLSRPNLFP